MEKILKKILEKIFKKDVQFLGVSRHISMKAFIQSLHYKEARHTITVPEAETDDPTPQRAQKE